MGMQISSYELIAALGGDATDDYAVCIRKALADFAMVAIVLHRPGVDEALGQVLQRQFAHLDHETGRHLLFFALTDAGPHWHEHAAQRAYYRVLHNAVPYAHPDCLEWADSDAAAVAVAGRLGIPAEELPCVVFTEDLGRDAFAWVGTGPDRLCDQLIRLANLSEVVEPAIRSRRGLPAAARRYATAAIDLDKVAAEVAGGDRYGVGEPDTSMVKGFLDVIAVGTDPGRGHVESKVRERRKQRVLALLTAEVADMRRLGHGDSEELAEKISELARLKALGLPKLKHSAGEKERRSLANRSPADLMGLLLSFAGPAAPPAWRNWHPDAQLAVTTADKLLHAFANEGAFDWSTAVVSTGKALEIETNHSIVQLLRLHLGAQMPDHYRKLVPNRVMQVPNGPTLVDLNASRRGKWAPLTLGVMGHLLSNPVSAEASTRIAGHFPQPVPTLVALAAIAHELVVLRNMGAHDEILPLSKAQQARAELDKLAENGGADFLSACKAMTAPQGTVCRR